MGKRILSAAAILALLFAFVYINYFCNIYIIRYVVAAITAMSLFEIYRPYGFTQHGVLAGTGLALAMFIVFGPIANGAYMLAVMSAFVFIILSAAVLFHSKITFRDVSIMMLSTLYVSFGMSHLRLVLDSRYGLYLFFAVLVGSVMTDTGGYFIGSAMGKHKLIEKISPKKTVEGAVGGVVFALAAYLLYGYIINLGFAPRVNWPALMLTGVVASVAAQMGDLAASMIKREIGIKDYGNIIPGHGGMLDRIDSIMFVAPVIYYANILFGIIR